MHAIRSILWIGPAPGLEGSGLFECPTLDITWVRDVTEALALPPSNFDLDVLDAVDPETASEPSSLAASVRRLQGGPRRSNLLVRLGDGRAADRAALLVAGAAEVLVLRDCDDAHTSRTAFLERVDRLCEYQPWRGRGDARLTTRSGELHDPPGPALPGLIGRSRAIEPVLALVERARHSTATVLLSGETGTGKEVIARGLHESSPRAGKPFVAVNCAAFPDSLLESELFGHVRGAFTGADRDRPGLFAEANGGTLFLDEIGETSGPLQATLLRALQEREVRPVVAAIAEFQDYLDLGGGVRDGDQEQVEERIRKLKKGL